MTKVGWRLYYHRAGSRTLAEFLKETTKLNDFTDVDIKSLPNKNSSNKFSLLPHSVRKLLFFGHPDVILSYYDGLQPEKAVFAWEITDAKPATDHWMQRFTSIAGACEVGVPSVFILRFETKTKPWSAKIKSEFFYAYDRVMNIHRIPIYIADWKSSQNGDLTEDADYPGIPERTSESMKDSTSFFNLAIEYTIHGRNLIELSQERLIVNLKNKLIIQISKIPKPSDYERLTVLDNSGYVDTSVVIDYIKKKIGKTLPNIPERIKMRKKSLYFVPRPRVVKRKTKETLLERIKKRNGNPYNGMPLAFDCMFCRLGPTPRERDVNLIIDLSELTFSDFAEFHKNIHDKSPLGKTSPPKKQNLPKYSLHLTQGYIHEIKDFIRQYCYAADIIVLKDFVVPFY
jgi:hypothetical protein